MVGWGIAVLAATFIGTCMVAAGSVDEADAARRGTELGQSPWLGIGLTLGVALITLGLVRKSNARRAADDRFREQHTTVEVVLDEKAVDGPFRGNMKEVEVLDPVIAAHEEEQRALDHRRGTVRLCIGGAIMMLTIVCVFTLGRGDAHGPRAVERMLSAVGMAMIPFGVGMYFAIRGLLLRSK